MTTQTYVLLIGYGPGQVYAVYATREAAEEEARRKRRYSQKPEQIRVVARRGTHPGWRKEATT